MNVLTNLRRYLGLTPRCIAVEALTVAVFITAMATDWSALYGVAIALAFLGGTLWDREIRCDGCAQSLEDRDGVHA